MPIVGSFEEGSTVADGNVSDWSHSTVFTTTRSTLDANNVPQLTTVWTPPPRCTNRWVAGSEQITATLAATTYVTTVALDNTTTTITHFALVRRAPPVTAEPRTGLETGFVAISTAPESSRGPPILAIFVAFSTNPGSPLSSELYDSLYSSCQPYGGATSYSPGICPEGQTVAEVTEFHYSTTADQTETYFQASCCRSGMTFGPAWESACISNISTPFKIYAPFTTYENGQTIPLITYEYTARTFVPSGYGTDGYSTATFSNISTVTTGLAAADPVVVAWQHDDLSVFPTDYVSSLAQRYNISTPPLPTPASTAGLAQQTHTPSADLSSGVKAGISIGVIVGVALLATVLISLLIRRRRTKSGAIAHRRGDIQEMEDQDEMLAKKKWYLWGRWRNEMGAEGKQHELDSRTVNVVPGPPAELDASERQRYDTISQ